MADASTPGTSNPFLKGNLIDGKAVAAKIRAEVSEKVACLKAEYGRVPGLAVVIVGERKDSQTYVRMKRAACEEVGIASFGEELPETISQPELLAVVRKFNNDPNVHGILIQLPLPKHIDEQEVLGAVSLDKDVDGFHPVNIGRLAMKGRSPLFIPCTPLGCIELLDRCGFEIRGKNAVVVGRSNIVGMPVAMLLLKRDATVTICHSLTQDMASIVRQADIVVAAAGRAELIRGSWIKPGAVIIDVGTNPVNDSTKKAGFRLVGDCAFEECKAVAAGITPVPGGVGPMTIAMLLTNTLESGRRFMAGEVSAARARAVPRWSNVALGAVVTAVALQRIFRLFVGRRK